MLLLLGEVLIAQRRVQTRAILPAGERREALHLSAANAPRAALLCRRHTLTPRAVGMFACALCPPLGAGKTSSGACSDRIQKAETARDTANCLQHTQIHYELPKTFFQRPSKSSELPKTRFNAARTFNSFGLLA